MRFRLALENLWSVMIIFMKLLITFYVLSFLGSAEAVAKIDYINLFFCVRNCVFNSNKQRHFIWLYIKENSSDRQRVKAIEAKRGKNHFDLRSSSEKCQKRFRCNWLSSRHILDRQKLWNIFINTLQGPRLRSYSFAQMCWADQRFICTNIPCGAKILTQPWLKQQDD